RLPVSLACVHRYINAARAYLPEGNSVTRLPSKPLILPAVTLNEYLPFWRLHTYDVARRAGNAKARNSCGKKQWIFPVRALYNFSRKIISVLTSMRATHWSGSLVLTPSGSRYLPGGVFYMSHLILSKKCERICYSHFLHSHYLQCF